MKATTCSVVVSFITSRALPAILLAGTLATISCTSSRPVSFAGDSSVATLGEPSQWVPADGVPGRYLPAGYGADAGADTGFSAGDWVRSAADGGLYFVPFAGIDGRPAAEVRAELMGPGSVVGKVGGALGDSLKTVTSVAVVAYGSVAEGRLPSEVIAEIEDQ